MPYVDVALGGSGISRILRSVFSVKIENLWKYVVLKLV